jgi:hypothetical protein
MLRLYSGLTGDVPYDAVTVAMVETICPAAMRRGISR